MSNPYNLQRFVDAQENVFENALAELRAGSKQSHWMWFIFPQLAGLGRSATARHYAISSLGEARAFLAHSLLGPRLRKCVDRLLDWSGRRSAEQILGSIDSLKLRSSLTLFDLIEPNSSFAAALEAFFAGRRDDRTLALLNGGR
ncbi:MAG TPA: DUF1810 domain-containing protein [Sphingomicrobium sp.]